MAETFYLEMIEDAERRIGVLCSELWAQTDLSPDTTAETLAQLRFDIAKWKQVVEVLHAHRT